MYFLALILEEEKFGIKVKSEKFKATINSTSKLGPRARKTWTLKTLDLEKHGS